MNKAFKNVALAVGIAASFVMAQAAEANTLELYRDDSATGFTGNIGGGEFGIKNVDPAGSFQTAPSPMKVSGYDFQTFCVESGQGLSGNPYTWATTLSLNNAGSVVLNSKVAYLYTVFWFGLNGFSETGKSMLSDGSGLNNASADAVHTFNYDYALGAGRKASSNDLQEALWFLMGQFQGSFSGLSAGAQEMVNLAYISTSTGGVWNTFVGTSNTSVNTVRILTLSNANGQQQDVLVLIQGGVPTTFSNPVPLPSSALMGLGLMAGIGAIGFIRRRRQTLS